MQTAELMQWLPHRPPFLFVDAVTQLVPQKSATGYKDILASEAFFAGHFPGNPVMPGVLMVEALAQLACILAFKSQGSYAGQVAYFMGIKQVRFRRVVRPGERLELAVEILRARANVWIFSGVAKVGAEVAVECEFTAGLKDAMAAK